MININILFFGKLKDAWENNLNNYQTSTTTIEILYEEILKQANEIPFKASIRVALNDEFVNWDSSINNGDTIAFLPPSSGG